MQAADESRAEPGRAVATVPPVLDREFRKPKVLSRLHALASDSEFVACADLCAIDSLPLMFRGVAGLTNALPAHCVQWGQYGEGS